MRSDSPMNLEALIEQARSRGASDLHLEPGLPPMLRVHGNLCSAGEALTPAGLRETLQGLLGAEAWRVFGERRSYDLTRVVARIRCRINVLQSSRGVGAAIRLLPAACPRLADLNLHPSFGTLVAHRHGLVIVSGATGSGKSTTMAALIEEINATRGGHILCIEQPIEYALRPRRALIRQREVGRDTPSFEQALVDAMREDPDAIMVGEMRTRETMRLTLDASETGHLVFVTMHAATPAEAVARIINAFPAEAQRSVCGQLADVLIAVLCQRLSYREPPGQQVPECEVLAGSTPARAIIRSGELFKLTSAMETGRDDGMWTLERYRAWLDARPTFANPFVNPLEEEAATIATSRLPALSLSVESPRGATQPDAATPESNTDGAAEADEGAEIESLISQLKSGSRPQR